MFVDIGNTNVKILSENGRITIIPTARFSNSNVLGGNTSTGAREEVIVASVCPEVLKKINKKYFLIDTNSKLSFNYSLEGVGVDRLLAVEGALTKSSAPLVVINAGTAITVNFVSLRNNEPYLEGGMILPGFSLSLTALNEHTAQLPKLNVEAPNGIIGTTTKDA
ncbi:MAG: type III pantothenate kinase, partial [Pseudomonadota bacterium]